MYFRFIKGSMDMNFIIFSKSKMYWTFPAYFPFFQQFCFPEALSEVKIQEEASKSALAENEKEEKDENKEKLREYLIQELSQKRENNKRKIWSEEEDQVLLELSKTETDWDLIASKIPEANKANCLRRYQRLMKEEALWSRQIDLEIVRLREEEGRQWSDIRKILHQTNHSASQIRERYQNQLRRGINREKWGIQEDLKLLELVSQHRSKWAEVCQNLPGRTERQVKNRYCRTLEPILRKSERLGIKNAYSPKTSQQS